YLKAHGTSVQNAAEESPGQWQTWYWICFGGGIMFLLSIPILRGRWRPSAARPDEAEHDAKVQAQLAKLNPRARAWPPGGVSANRPGPGGALPVALQADVVDVGLERAGRIGRQPGEPDEDVAAAGRPGEVEPQHSARAGRARDGRHVRQRGPAADTQLEAGAGGVAEVDPRAGDGDRPAHGQQQAGARVQVSEAGRGVPVAVPACRGPAAEDPGRRLRVVAAVRAERPDPSRGQRPGGLGGRRGWRPGRASLRRR